jgi:hypothetical protein
MFQLESSRIGINIVNVLLQCGNGGTRTVMTELAYSFIYLSIHSFICLFIHLSARPSRVNVYSFIHSFICLPEWRLG